MECAVRIRNRMLKAIRNLFKKLISLAFRGHADGGVQAIRSHPVKAARLAWTISLGISSTELAVKPAFSNLGRYSSGLKNAWVDCGGRTPASSKIRITSALFPFPPICSRQRPPERRLRAIPARADSWS